MEDLKPRETTQSDDINLDAEFKRLIDVISSLPIEEQIKYFRNETKKLPSGMIRLSEADKHRFITNKIDTVNSWTSKGSPAAREDFIDVKIPELRNKYIAFMRMALFNDF